MNKRILIAAVILLVVIGVILLPKITQKKDTGNLAQVSTSRSQVSNFDSKIKEAQAFEDKGSLLEAKEIYIKLIEMPLNSEQMNLAQANIENLNIKILCSGINIENSQIYEVKPGDVLINIAKKFNTTVDNIVKANNIKNNLIRPGMKLRILSGKFSIFVDKSQNTLILKFNGEVVKTYTVATGKNNSTPVGTFKIINKLVSPVWYKDGKAIAASSPENVLGSRWMGFDLPEYGIHGTTSPELMGMQITEGCVRMKDSDVEELYGLIPVGTEVAVVD